MKVPNGQKHAGKWCAFVSKLNSKISTQDCCPISVWPLLSGRGAMLPPHQQPASALSLTVALQTGRLANLTDYQTHWWVRVRIGRVNVAKRSTKHKRKPSKRLQWHRETGTNNRNLLENDRAQYTVAMQLISH